MDIPRVPPLTIALLSATLKQADVGSITAIDLDLEFNHSKKNIDYFVDQAIKRVEKEEPMVICLTCMTAQFPFIVLFSKKYKLLHPMTKIIVGGWMPTLNPKLVLQLSKCDVVIRGEAERSLPILLHEINSDKWTIDGLSYIHSDDVIVHNPNSIVLNQPELDRLPLPNYDALPPLSRYQPEFKKFAFVVQASRGCVNHKCIFCWNSTKYCDTRWRARNPTKVVEEIRYLVEKYNGYNFMFADDSFGADTVWLNKFISLMMSNFKSTEIEYGCSMRIDTIDDCVLENLYKSGLRGIFHGIESGSPRFWKILNKNYSTKVTREYILKTIKKEIKIGIIPKCSFMINLPNETEEDLNHTISLCKELSDIGATFAFQILVPNEGTVLYERYRDLIEPIDVYHETGFFDSFWPHFRTVFNDRFIEFFNFLPDNKWIKPSMSLDLFKTKFSVLQNITYSEVKPFF